MFRRLRLILIPWLALRIFLSVVAIAGTSNRREPGTVQLAPHRLISDSWSDSAQQILLEPWRRWDVDFYVKIADCGYEKGDGTAQFHPLYPLLGRVIGKLLGGNMLAGLWIASNIFGLLFLFVFQRLAELDLSTEMSNRAAILFLHLPVAFILFAPYTESLFLLCAGTSFLMARRERFGFAGVAGGLAAMTRQQGIFLLIPLAWEFWESVNRDTSLILSHWRRALGLLLVPAGLLLWLLYRAVMLSDVSVDPFSFHTWIYGLLISKDASHVVAGQAFVAPWKAFAAALASMQPATIIDLILGMMFLALFSLLGRTLWSLRPSYFLYTAAIILVSFSYQTGSYQPYMGLPRHCLLAFPLIIPLAKWARNSRRESVLVILGSLGSGVLAYCYAATILWVP